MSSQGINVGGIYADLNINTGNLDRGLAAGRQALEAIDREVRQLTQNLNSGAIGLMEYTARTNVLAQTQRELSEHMRNAYAATRTLNTGLELVKTNANGMTSVASRMGQSLMQVGYIMDDIQYGFSGVVNNIAPLVGGLTGNAGLATAAQIAAVGAFQLYDKWDQLQEAMGAGIPTPALEGLKAIETQLKAVSKEIDELAKKGRFSDLSEAMNDAANRKLAGSLGEASKEQKSVDDLEGGTKEEQARGRAFVDAIREQGGGKLAKSALVEEFKDRADAEGRTLGADEINDLMKKKGITGGDPNKSLTDQIKDVVGLGGGIDRGKLSAVGEMLGIKFDAETMDETYRNEGISLEDQIKKQLGNQLFLHDDRSGEMLTPEAMARRRLTEGSAGNKAAATEVGSILDDRVGGTFSKEFNENSPEGKEAKKLADKKEKEDKKRRKDAEQDRQKAMGRHAYLEELEFNGFITDGEAAELSDLERAENKRNDQAREKKAREAKQARRDNEREAREQAPGIKTLSEMLAMQALGGAITPDQARDAIAKHLVKEGVAAEKSVGAADDIFTDAQRDVKEGVIKRLYDGKQEKQKTSQVFDASTLAAKFQSSVGGDDAKKMLSITEKMEKHLDMMAKAGVLNIRVVKK